MDKLQIKLKRNYSLLWVFQFRDKIKKKKELEYLGYETIEHQRRFFSKSYSSMWIPSTIEKHEQKSTTRRVPSRFAQNFFNKSVARGMHCMRHTNDARHAISRNVSSFCLHFSKLPSWKTLHVLSFSPFKLVISLHLWTWKKQWTKWYIIFYYCCI